MVRLEDVGMVRLNPKGEEVAILAGISFSARPGEITAIVGPSGGGKSTLVRFVNRLDEPTSGRIWLDWEDVSALDPLQLRRRVGMVLQKPFMFEGTVLVNLQRPFLYRNAPPPGAGSGGGLGALELARLSPELLERDARTLSLGQQQRVSLARGPYHRASSAASRRTDQRPRPADLRPARRLPCRPIGWCGENDSYTDYRLTLPKVPVISD